MRGAALLLAVLVAGCGSPEPEVPALDPVARDALVVAALEAEARWDTTAAVQSLGQAHDLDPASFEELPRLVYLTSLVHEADLKAKRERMLAMAEAGAAAGTPRAGEAEVVAWTAIVNEGLHDSGQRQASLEALEASMAGFEPPARTDSWYHLAEAKLLLGDLEGAEAAMVEGSREGGHTWEELIQLQGLLFLHSRRGDDVVAARAAYLERLEAWEEPHFAWRMALADFVTLDALVDGLQASTAPDIRAMAGRAEAAGVATQVGNEQLAATLPELFSALETDDVEAALARIRDLLTLLARDRGCVTETVIIRPHLTADLLRLRARLLEGQGDEEGGAAALRKAALIEPDNPVLAGYR